MLLFRLAFASPCILVRVLPKRKHTLRCHDQYDSRVRSLGYGDVARRPPEWRFGQDSSGRRSIRKT